VSRKVALVTGASKGIGKAISKELASRDFDLVLVARNLDELENVGKQIQAHHNVNVHVRAIDLSSDDAVLELSHEIKKTFNYNLRILVNNAGYGMWGAFPKLDLKEQQAMMIVNMMAPVILTHTLLPVLAQNGPSHILNVSSSTAYQALATMSVYAATKSFILQFSRSLRLECKKLKIPVHVTCVSPGATKTNFIARADMGPLEKLSEKVGMTPEAVALFAVNAMFSQKAEVIPGLLNKAGASFAKYLPKSVAESVASNLYIKKLKEKNNTF